MITLNGTDISRVIRITGGTDTIIDYEEGVDKILFRAIGGTPSIANITIANNLAGDAVITYSEGSVTLTGIDQGLLDASDFLF